MKNDTFEDFLQKKYFENYMGTNDDFADAYTDYVSNLQVDDLLTLTDEWTKTLLEFVQLKVKQIKGVYSAHDALTEVDKLLETLK